jgi:hypothetical protein
MNDPIFCRDRPALAAFYVAAFPFPEVEVVVSDLGDPA